MAHFITHLGTHEPTIDKVPQWNTIILLFCEAALVTKTLAVLTLLWWRSAEAARVRKTKTRRDGSQILPSPIPVLPRWLGFLGGHTLLIKIPKVIGSDKSNNILLYTALLTASVIIRRSRCILIFSLNTRYTPTAFFTTFRYYRSDNGNFFFLTVPCCALLHMGQPP